MDQVCSMLVHVVYINQCLEVCVVMFYVTYSRHLLITVGAGAMQLTPTRELDPGPSHNSNMPTKPQSQMKLDWQRIQGGR